MQRHIHICEGWAGVDRGVLLQPPPLCLLFHSTTATPCTLRGLSCCCTLTYHIVTRRHTPFYFSLDDDCMLTGRSNLTSFHEFLSKSDYDVVAGSYTSDSGAGHFGQLHEDSSSQPGQRTLVEKRCANARMRVYVLRAACCVLHEGCGWVAMPWCVNGVNRVYAVLQHRRQ